jgi:ribosomal peptide maturation radical SAM protein 1
MPFAAAQRPSIQIGLLKSLAEQRGFSTVTMHLSVILAKILGLPLYSQISDVRGLLGEWLFSIEAFGQDAPDHAGRFLDESHEELLAKLQGLDCPLDRLMHIRSSVIPLYLDQLETSIAWSRYAVVGFTSTFQQTLPSIALARRIKTLYPKITIVFGGANFEAGMGIELVRAVPWIDYAVIGEGDAVFLEFLAAIRAGTDPSDIPGIATMRNSQVKFSPQRAPFHDMDALPTPDYSEFFERAETEGIISASNRTSVHVPFESARGCWWGEKHHCTFCGLNGQTMSFRPKSAEHVLGEIDDLHRRHGSIHFESVDNIIDNRFFETLLPRLAERRGDFSFFYEVKANLSRERIRLLCQAGVNRIQPGIESLSTRVLHLMRKGVNALQNINTLRWAQYYGIHVDWNFLWGFPGETAEDYSQQATLLRHLVHLMPAGWYGRFWMERFSPAYTDRGTFPTRRVAPDRNYAFIFPRYVDLAEVAYFFDYEFIDSLPDAVYADTAACLERWKEAWLRPTRPSLLFRTAPDSLTIEDLRDPSSPETHTFSGHEADVYLCCSDRPTTMKHICRTLALVSRLGM